LNICQTFYYFYIYFNNKEYIMFKIYYKIYKYKILFFNLINKFTFYQKYINNILIKYLNNFYIIYLNNILIYFENSTKYYLYIKKILIYLYKTKL
jgi:hypothetical protein